MSTPALEEPCVGKFGRGPHDWELWCSTRNDTIDPQGPDWWRYRRSCTIMGCPAVQYAENVEPWADDLGADDE